MDNVKALSKGTQIFGAAAILLLIDTFLDWQQVCVGAGGFKACGGASGWHGFWGVVLGLLTVAAIVWVVVRVVQADLLKSIPVPEGTLALGLGALILLFAVLKNLIDDYSHWPAYVGVLLAAAVAFGGWMIAQEQGGTEKAMAWRPSGMSSGAAATTSPPPPAPETTAPPATEPAPPAEPPPAETSTWSPPPPPESPESPPAGQQH